MIKTKIQSLNNFESFCNKYYDFKIFDDNELGDKLNKINSLNDFKKFLMSLLIKKEISTNIETMLRNYLYKYFDKTLDNYTIVEIKNKIFEINKRNKKIIEIVKNILTDKNNTTVIKRVNKFIFNENLKMIRNFNGKNCYFCSQHRKIEKKLGNILYETKNFYLKLGYGIITCGHIMIIPKQHIPCYGDLRNKNKIEEFKNLLNNTCEFLKQIFNSNDIILCEYGGCGQSVFHSHLHLIPAEANFTTILNSNKLSIDNRNKCQYNIKVQNIISMEREYFKKNKCDFIETTVKNIEDLTKCFTNRGAYISYGSFNSKTITLFQPNNSKSYEIMNNGVGYRGYFSKLGLAGVSDWKNQSADDKILDTLKREETKRKLANISIFLNQ